MCTCTFSSKHFGTFSINSSSFSNRCSYSKKLFDSETTLIIWNEEVGDIMAIIKKKQIYWCTLVASLLGNMLKGKGVIQAGEDKIRAGEGTSSASQDF